MLLSVVGRLGTHLALSMRLAMRDTARQRGRSTPAVAAIMAAVAALTALSIGAASDMRQAQLEYAPRQAMGQDLADAGRGRRDGALTRSDLRARPRAGSGEHGG
jgi:putative ABC transport system permease protein